MQKIQALAQFNQHNAGHCIKRKRAGERNTWLSAHAPDHPGDDPTGHDRCNAINTTLIRNELERNPAKHLRRAWNPLCIGFSTLVVPSNAPSQRTTRILTTNAKACRIDPIGSLAWTRPSSFYSVLCA